MCVYEPECVIEVMPGKKASSQTNKVAAIIVAAGTSSRMRGTDKAFVIVDGRPLLAYTLDVFQRSTCVDQIVLLLSERNLERGSTLVEDCGFSKVSGVYPGGQRRQDTVAEGLKRVEEYRWLIIHDGARPCLSVDLIERGLREAQETGAAIAAVPVKDTIKEVGSDRIVTATLARDTLWAVQTPQIFRRDILVKAYDHAKQDVTDDAALVEALGHKVRVYMGLYENIKVTTPEDLALVEIILSRRQKGIA